MSRHLILLVDADAGAGSDLRFALERMDFAVHTAACEEEAAQRIAEVRPDVIVLDLRQSGKSSLETLAAIAARALEWQTDISSLRDVERRQIQRALHATGGRRAKAARLLGISERNLYRKIHTYHLESRT